MNSIVIADSHTLCREALCDYIRHADKALSVEGFSDFTSLKKFLDTGVPDLVLVDRDLPGFEEDIGRDLKIGILVPWLDESLYAGSHYHGIFPKTLSSKEFLSGIQEILSGRTFYPPAQNPYLSRAAVKEKPAYDFGLTPREKEVLTYLVKGSSNKDIARGLDLQVVTVKLHVRGICRKMKAGNRTQAAIIAKENGWG